MMVLKSKLINWSHNQLSLAGRILVANQVLLASMWYIAACWNPNPQMTTQIRGVVRNFIWGGKDAPARAKVKWDTLTISTTQGGLGIIDPKCRNPSLGSRPRQGGCKGAGQKEARESHQDSRECKKV